MAKKKVKVKVKKKKLKIKKIIIFLFIFLLLLLTITYIINLPIKNIYIEGNKFVSDKEIIKLAQLDNHPSIIKTYFNNPKKKILKNHYIKSVKITRNLIGKIYIYVEEYRPICIYKDKLVLSSLEKVDNTLNINYLPFIINDIDAIYQKFVEKFSLINNEILIKISHIEYVPNEVDKERFILYMTDSNYIYITLNKIEKLNKYNSIIKELEGKKGIIYLDSGDYIEIKGVNIF